MATVITLTPPLASNRRRIAGTHFIVSSKFSSSPFSPPPPSPPPPKPPLLQQHCALKFSSHQKASRLKCLAQFASPPITSPASLSPPTTEILEAEELPSVPPISIGRIVVWVLVLAPLCCLPLLLGCGSAAAATAAVADDSIRASRIGLKIATALRGTGWADEAIVFALATLPVLELRGAIPVGYWMQLNPLLLTALSILGNMVPVPFIILYLKRLASFLSRKNASATRFLDLLIEKARDKAGPVKEFQWLGLMLFVAVPFPGTGAWTGAVVASVLDMPFWSAVSANFFGVILAGLLVNLLVNLGLKYAIATGLLLFLVSTVMWSVLRRFKKSMNID